MISRQTAKKDCDTILNGQYGKIVLLMVSKVKNETSVSVKKNKALIFK